MWQNYLTQLNMKISLSDIYEKIYLETAEDM